MRDGVSLSHHTRQKPLVMPTELSQLEDLECYIKLPGDYPCTKLQMAYQTTSRSTVEAFLLKPEKPMSYEEIQESEATPMVKKAKKKPVKQEVIIVSETSEEENEALV